MEDNEKWLLDRFAKGVIPPFSFVYNGKHSSEFIKNWRFDHGSGQKEDTSIKHLFTYSDMETGSTPSSSSGHSPFATA